MGEDNKGNFTVIKKKMLTCVFRAHVKISKIEIMYWKLWLFISQKVKN